MIWKWLTGLLFALSVVICVWTYLRDRATPVVLQPGPNVAQAADAARADGDRLLNVLAPRPACGRRCGVGVYESSSDARWRVTLTGPAWQRCFVITLSEFNYTDARGFSGLQSVTCSEQRS